MPYRYQAFHHSGFNGDVEGLADAPWTLVVSLNHQMGEYPNPPTAGNYWEFCRLHNQNHWYAGFFRPLVRVAATYLGKTVAADEEPEFASRRMVFVELCPYASQAVQPPDTSEWKSSLGARAVS